MPKISAPAKPNVNQSLVDSIVTTAAERRVVKKIQYRIKQIKRKRRYGMGLDLQRKFRQYWLVLISGFIIVYFGFHSFCGERNIYRYFALKQEIAKAQETAQKYALQKQKLQRKVQHLSDISLDIDLLDERARVVLNMAADDEFVILDKDID